MADAASIARYAVYYAPDPAEPLWSRASGIIGYDAYTGRAGDLLPPDGWTAAAWHEATREPRRYGFHATLKAPFRLLPGATEAGLLDAAATFSQVHRAIEVGPVCVAGVSSFVAIVPANQTADLMSFAGATVEAFEPFRAPLSEADYARRRPDRLDGVERAYLDRYGYPYVFDRFRFHMTLSGQLDPATREATRLSLETLLHDALPVSMTIDRIAVFRQPTPDSSFSVVATFPLSG